jgi:iron-regulated transporter 1
VGNLVSVCMLSTSFLIMLSRFSVTHRLQIPVVLVLWNLSPKSPDTVVAALKSRKDTAFDTSKTASLHPIIPITLFAFLSISRVGHYMIHLMVQELGQVEVTNSQRSTFAGTEQSFNSLFGMCHWAATVGWSRPDQFRFLALGSLLVIGVGVAVFAWWLRKPIGKDLGEYESIAMVDVPCEDMDEED